MAKKKQKGRKFKPFKPLLVGDFRGTSDRDEHGRYAPKFGGMQRIDYEYPNEPGGLEEGIMGIPAWALLLGGVLAVGAIVYIRRQ